MNANKQNNIDHLRDMMERGLMTLDQANVEMVRGERVRVVVNRLPANIRKALNGAVKVGLLCHTKKDGLKPEVYYHPKFEYLATAERNKREREGLAAIKRYAGWKD